MNTGTKQNAARDPDATQLQATNAVYAILQWPLEVELIRQLNGEMKDIRIVDQSNVTLLEGLLTEKAASDVCDMLNWMHRELGMAKQWVGALRTQITENANKTNDERREAKAGRARNKARTPRKEPKFEKAE